MLKNILINAGRFTPIATAGNHINIVLAAGEIEIRAELENGSVYSTPAVQGMALELPRFKSVHVGGKTSQQTKIWVGDIPLSYSPDTQRAVGSNALSSSVVQVFSNSVTEILPAQVGRNKITLNPSKEIYIGGADITLKSGIKLPANAPFTLQTQGAVYAFEKSGEYPLSYTAELTPADLQTPKIWSGGRNNSAYLEPQSKSHVWQFVLNQKAVYKHDRDTGGEVTSKLANYNFTEHYVRVDDLVLWAHTNYASDVTYLVWFDLETGAESSRVIDTFTDDYTEMFYRAGVLYFLGGRTKSVVTLNFYDEAYKTAPFVVLGQPVPIATTIPQGVLVGAGGEIIAIGEDEAYISEDNGQTWEKLANVLSTNGIHATYGNWLMDKENDFIFATFDGTDIYRSIDYGRTFEKVIDNAYGAIYGMSEYNGNVIVSAANATYFWNGKEWVTHVHDYSESSEFPTINPTGRVYTNHGSSNVNVYEGQRVAKNGLPVAVMAEIN